MAPSSKDTFDAEAFAKDVRAARDKAKPSEEEEQRHLAKIELWTTIIGVSGLALAVRGVVSPVSMVLLGLYKFAKFAILAHHSLHGGWGRSRRSWFAMGPYRRVVDWLDWIFPQAWIVEHNKEHHYYLNEDADPDFVQRNLETMHAWPLPLALKYVVAFVLACTWKWYYYASNTLKLLHRERPNAPKKAALEEPIAITGLISESIKGDPWHRSLLLDFIFRVMGPPFFLQFVLVPMVAGMGLRGAWLCPITLLNLLGAETVTNLWAFCCIATNHCGADLWWFPGSCRADSAEFYLRAVLGSTAYHAGNDVVDYLHGYLNYQGEHHAFPELTPLHYQRFHPLFKAVCSEYGVPYVQEPFWVRTKKTADVVVGVAKHKVMKGDAVANFAQWRQLLN